MLKLFFKIVPFSLLITIIKAVDQEYAVLAAENSSEKENFCVVYFKEFAHLPKEKSQAEIHLIKDDEDINWCDNHTEADVLSKILLVSRNNCSVSEQAGNVQDHGGMGVLFITPSGRIPSVSINGTLAKDINITVGLIAEKSVERLKEMAPVSGRLFAPSSLNFDVSLLVIWVLAMFTVTVGSYWSGHIRFAIYCKEMSLLPGGNERELPNKPRVKANTAEDSSINVSAYYVTFFVCMMGVMLVLLYFFFDYLVYFIIGLFVLASILSIHSCLEPLVLKIPASLCRPCDFRIRSVTCNVDFRQILLLAFAVAVSVGWVIIRKQKHAWILQDILGIAFCIHMLKSIRLPSLKICTVLLVLLFFYDIFFVFVTPLFTMRGESVMEEVATGGKSESLPMVLRVVHFGYHALSVCYEPVSILGFGDILVPGLLISYCHGFDLITNKKILYFPITVATYGIGLLITFVGLFLMNTAQPALLYLVPATLIPPIILGWCRGELPLLWNGFKVISRQSQAGEAPKCSDVHVTADDTAVEASGEGPVFTDRNLNGDETKPSEATTEITGERKHLLR